LPFQTPSDSYLSGEKIQLKAFFVNVSLALCGILFALASGEAAYRLYLSFTLERSPADLHAALEQSVTTDLTEIGDSSSLRGLVQPSSVPDMVFELKPNLRGRFLGKGLRTNNFGMRGPDTTLEKPEGVLRIAGLGDSVMFGWGVEEDETYLSIIESRLKEEGINAEVLNFAVPGYNTAMELATFREKAIHFEPDLVLLHFVNNDLDVPHFMLEEAITPILYGSKLLGQLKALLTVEPTETGLLDIASRRLDEEAWDDVLEQYRYMVGPRAFRGFLRELARLCSKNEIPFVMLVGAHTRLTREISVGRMVDRFSFDVLEALPTVNAYFEENYPGSDRRLRQQKLWVSEQDSHPNALGHRLYAEALWPLILERLTSDENSETLATDR